MGDERTEQRAARDALGHDLERALFHLKRAKERSGHREELRSGVEDAARAVAALVREASLGRVHASTGAERDAAAPGNLVVGVTAHCTCGRTFTDDVRCCAPGPEDPGRPAGAAPPDGLEDLHRRHPHLAGNHVDDALRRAGCAAPEAAPQPAADAADEDRASMAAWGDPEGFGGHDFDA